MTVLGCNTTVPPHWALAFADSVAEFMVERFQQELLPPSQRSQNPKHLPQVNLETLCEAQLMVSRLVSAYKNQGNCIPTPENRSNNFIQSESLTLTSFISPKLPSEETISKSTPRR
ncbi:hypothetical protein JVT61DRAFT_12597 [Boletus reticuloceps]|uniref:Uncharacterized protein n=1 Tax=Boletus reticuloceps TaxID=495285 RepID=A0A8I2YDE8_9AGAM|nr:hypothetical protein JVT61DRAFT_12597 [Boletus reticuloceps]